MIKCKKKYSLLYIKKHKECNVFLYIEKGIFFHIWSYIFAIECQIPVIYHLNRECPKAGWDIVKKRRIFFGKIFEQFLFIHLFLCFSVKNENTYVDDIKFLNVKVMGRTSNVSEYYDKAIIARHDNNNPSWLPPWTKQVLNWGLWKAQNLFF